MKRAWLLLMILAISLLALPAAAEGVSYGVTVTAFTPATHGTADAPDGVNGSVTFTVTVVKGKQQQTTRSITIPISAVPYAGVSNADAVEAARAALAGLETEAVYAYGAGVAGRDAAALSACWEALNAEPKAAGVTLAVTLTDKGDAFFDAAIAITKGAHAATAAAELQLVELADPRIAEAVAAIEGAYAEVVLPAPSTSGDPPDNYPPVAEAAANAAYAWTEDLTYTRGGDVYIAPAIGTPENQYGVDGSYSFYYTVGNVAQPQYATDTATISLPVPASPLDALGYAYDLVYGAYKNTTYTNPDAEDKAAAIAERFRADAETALAPYTANGIVPAASLSVTYDSTTYQAATDGTAAYPDGESGVLSCALTVHCGDDSRDILPFYMLTITPVPYAGLTDAQAVANAKAALDGKTVNASYAYDSGDAGRIAAALAACQTLVSAADGVSLSVALAPVAGDQYAATVTITKGEVPATDTATVTATLTEAIDPRITTAIDDLNYEIPRVSLPAPMASDNPPSNYPGIINNAADAAHSIPSDMTRTFNYGSYTAPQNGTIDDPDGTNGTYNFSYTVANARQSQSTNAFSLAAPAVPVSEGRCFSYAYELVSGASYPARVEHPGAGADVPGALRAQMQAIASGALSTYNGKGLPYAASVSVTQNAYEAAGPLKDDTDGYLEYTVNITVGVTSGSLEKKTVTFPTLPEVPSETLSLAAEALSGASPLTVNILYPNIADTSAIRSAVTTAVNNVVSVRTNGRVSATNIYTIEALPSEITTPGPVRMYTVTLRHGTSGDENAVTFNVQWMYTDEPS